MRHETHFFYNGRWSYDMGVIKASLNQGLFEDMIVSNKEIIEERIEGREKPYFYKTQRQPLTFSLPIYFDENLTNDKIREILRWLDTDTFEPFYMIDNPEKIWYAMTVDDVVTIHNGINSGLMELQMRTDSPTAFTPYTLSSVYEFRNNHHGRIIEFVNSGDFDCKPIVHIKKVGFGNLAIQNLTNDEGVFEFIGLLDNEELYVDCENKEIVTNGALHRYNSFSKNYLTFVRGVNRLKVIGNCDLRFETEFKIY